MEDAKCYLCKREVDAEDALCYGCNQNICDVCDRTDPWGNHDPEDHL